MCAGMWIHRCCAWWMTIVLSKAFIPQGIVTESDFIDSLLNTTTYNKVSRPFLVEGMPVRVKVDLFISSISDISVITMDYKVNFYLRQRWKDPRLAFENHSIYDYELTLNPMRLIQVWKPSTYIRNEKTSGEVHDVTVPNIMLKLDPTGTILYSQRISTTITCSMNLQKYPLDEQTCALQLEIYSHETQDVLLNWNRETPLQLKKGLQLPEFYIDEQSTLDCTEPYQTTGKGTFSCIEVTFTLRRRIGYYLIQLFVPSLLIVVLSWVSFWIDLYAVPARISVGLLSVLTITTQASSINTNLPRVSYVKAIDVWMFTCMVFVFSSLLEFSVVNVLARRQKNKAIKRHHDNLSGRNFKEGAVATKWRNAMNSLKQRKKEQAAANNGISEGVSDFEDKVDISGAATLQPDESSNPWMFHDFWQTFKFKFRTDHALRVDVISRIVFPASFVLFNVAYWTFYTLK